MTNLSLQASAILFIVVLVSYSVQTQLTQHVQATLGYHHPYFVFYLAHSTFSLVLPLHLACLQLIGKGSVRQNLELMKTVMHADEAKVSKSSKSWPSPRWIMLMLIMTALLTIPSVSWYVAVTMTSIADLTAIYNTNAFYVYVMSVYLLGEKWSRQKTAAVVVACLGVFLIAYGSELEGAKKSHVGGNILALFASVMTAFYTCCLVKYGSLTEDLDEDSSDEHLDSLLHASPAAELPSGVHSSLVASTLGFLTLICLWIPIPILHWTGTEHFSLPSLEAGMAIAGVGFCGLVFTGGYMVLLYSWGPVVSSVAALLTIVLVTISDQFFNPEPPKLTFWSFAGCAAIAGGFVVLATHAIRESAMKPHRKHQLTAH